MQTCMSPVYANNKIYSLYIVNSNTAFGNSPQTAKSIGTKRDQDKWAICQNVIKN